MKFTSLRLQDVICIEPKVFSDERGFFLESYQAERFAGQGITLPFVQDNHSRSTKGVLRGLHYQLAPCEQGKLVRVTKGAIFDVAVDIRPGSATFGQWVGEILDAENKKMLYIPPGFAHGFCAVQDQTDVLYKATHVYAPESDRGILWNDPDIGIAWPDIGMEYLISPKDRNNPCLKELT
ncbi:dTDP-4-dehydrorhamnose 3,5-epimerase [bacterium]|nr:dTDP-4-dehydrorhamnose 3,5-epimerase [bacterium]